jgi:hypothetical protein
MGNDKILRLPVRASGSTLVSDIGSAALPRRAIVNVSPSTSKESLGLPLRSTPAASGAHGKDGPEERQVNPLWMITVALAILLAVIMLATA